MKQLVYVSKATTGQSPEVLRSILHVSQHKNRDLDVTGALFFYEGRYIQYLEGPVASVNATIARIRTDRRHQNIDVLLDGPVDRRLFRNWSMGNVPLDAAAWRLIARADWPTLRPLGGRRIQGLEVLQAIMEQRSVRTLQAVETPDHPAGPTRRPKIVATAVLVVAFGCLLGWSFLS